MDPAKAGSPSRKVSWNDKEKIYST
jgi:hypothetical protein